VNIRSPRTLATVAFGCAGFVIAYALVRTLGALQGREAPTAVLWVEHSPLRWSLIIAFWLAGMAALAGWLAIGRDPDKAPGRLGFAVIAATVAILAQGLLLP